MAIINYNDKQFLNENASIPAENKVSASDMNEIKNIVNSNAIIQDKIYQYIQNRYKSLWTGTWASGSLTVTDSSKYNSFIVTVGNIPVVCYKTSAGRVAGASASAPGSGARYDRLFSATTNGDVWTIEWLKELTHNANAGHGAFGTSSITEIVGLDPILE